MGEAQVSALGFILGWLALYSRVDRYQNLLEGLIGFRELQVPVSKADSIA